MTSKQVPPVTIVHILKESGILPLPESEATTARIKRRQAVHRQQLLKHMEPLDSLPSLRLNVDALGDCHEVQYRAYFYHCQVELLSRFLRGFWIDDISLVPQGELDTVVGIFKGLFGPVTSKVANAPVRRHPAIARAMQPEHMQQLQALVADLESRGALWPRTLVVSREVHAHAGEDEMNADASPSEFEQPPSQESKRNDVGLARPVKTFVDKSPAPWLHQVGAFDTADKRLQRMAEKKNQSQYQRGREQVADNSAHAITHSRASQRQCRPLAVSNAFGLLSTIKEEPENGFHAPEDGTPKQLVESAKNRTTFSDDQSNEPSIPVTTAVSSGDAFSSISRKRDRIATRSSARSERVAVGMRNSWRIPLSGDSQDAGRAHSRSRDRDVRKGSNWMNKGYTDGRDLDWGRGSK
ncbi:hypothetical protein LTR70_006787 [Exophiala xenobiotica]|uniref:Uncharacterized protein n=1 Tax=Lithohypha guttulata TaxID=1690604 RepID=A0ABR0K659_9EURO|nr:hypothetical protein LTR24_006357 [Lithohypha guttulata]KAK5315356.1 hypothetical protein LTR70_006787 [Exophiala xenobiotica]